MGEAKRKERLRQQAERPRVEACRQEIDLYTLPPVATIYGKHIRELVGDDSIPIPETAQIVLQAYKAVVGNRSFHVGFCIGDETGYSAIGFAVIERLMMEVGDDAPLHVVRVAYADIAWDIVLRHLRSFTGGVLLFAFPDSDIYDAGTAEKHYSSEVRIFGHDGEQLRRLTTAQRRKVLEDGAVVLNRPAPKIYETNIAQSEVPWIFRIVTPAGKELRTAVWNGRRNYLHQIPPDIITWVGGDKIAIVQVEKPVGVDRRSSLNLTHTLASDFDGVIHWARDTETFESILKSFIRLDLESVSPPDLPEDWKPEVIILSANGRGQ